MQRNLSILVNKSSSPPSPRPAATGWISGAQFAQFASTATDAHRLCTTPGGWVERFGDDVLISYKDEAAQAALLAGLRSWREANGLQSKRIFGKFLPRQNEERIAPVLLEGDVTLPLDTVVMENGVRYGLDFGAGYSAGLFIDQRANRAYVGRVAPLRLLNTF